MIFSVFLVKDDVLGAFFVPCIIKKLDQKNCYKIIQQVTNKDIEKHDFLQLIWIKEIINLLENFKLKNLNLKFNKKHQKVSYINYLKKVTKQELTYISDTLDRFNANIINLIKNNELFVFNKPARDQFIYEKDIFNYSKSFAKVKFDFKKENNSLYYRLYLFINHKKIDIKNSKLTILCNNNPCILYENTLYWFDTKTEFNGNKLKPFLTKDEIVIPEKMQEVYFEKFVKNAVNNFEYHIEGFDIKNIKTDIKAVLNFEKTFTNQFIVSLNFNYNEKIIPYHWKQQEFVKVVRINEEYALESFIRDATFENNKIKILKNLKLIDKHKYFKFEENFNSKSEFINYLKPIIKNLKNENFSIQNRLFKQQINFEKPKISYSTKKKQDWFDLRIVIVFKNFKIPFLNFKNHILNHNTEFELPDKTIFIIPNEWFSELNAFAKRTNNDNETTIHISNFSLLKEHQIILPNDDIKETIKGFTSTTKITLPKNSIAQLRDYQEFGYQWLSKTTLNNFGACLADDMGLGKTLQVITLLQKYFEDKVINTTKTINKQLDLFSFEPQTTKLDNTFKSTLIVLPRVLIVNWKNELQKFASDLTFTIYYGTKRKEILQQNLHKKQLILTTYGVVRQDIDLLKNKEFSYLILDESQAIKNPNSKIYKAITQLQANFKISITGTPIENNLTDIWSQMNFLNPNILGNLNYFKNAYIETINNNTEAPEIDDLKTIIKPFILRRLKKDVAKELPDKIEQTIYCEMDEEQQKQYDKEKFAVRNELLFKEEKNMINVLSVLNRLRQFVLHPKLVNPKTDLNSGKFEQIKTTIDSLIAQGNKFLIFSSFVKHLDIYRVYFEENNIDFNILTGKTKNPQAIVEKYQEDKTVLPFLISIKAGGVGLNITAANYVLIIDPWWNPFVEQQAIDRTHRIGQTKNVFVYKFITQNSIEEKILNLQHHKIKMSNALINKSNALKINLKDVLGILE